ncbi:MAG TPA: RNA polymerase sigma factor [Acidimicrobiales bacterium]
MDDYDRSRLSDDDRVFTGRLARARSGDPRAFEELLRWLERPVGGYLRARGADDWEALANDVFVRAFGAIDGFEGNAVQFRAWVFRIARNALIDERRHRARRVDTVVTVPHELPDAGTADHLPDHLGERDRVEALLGELTDEQREVVLLRVVGGLNVEETAEVVGRRPGAVRALQHRALTRLRRSLSHRP